MIVFSFSIPRVCLFFLVLVNAWLTNPCLVIVFRAEFLSDVSCPWCSLYLVDRSSIFLWPLHAVPCWFILFIYLFLAALGLCGGVRTSHCGGFSCCGAPALGAWTSAVVACGLSSCGSRALECRLSSCGARAQLLLGMWDLPGPGLEPLSPLLAGRFLTTAPPGKPPCCSLLTRDLAFKEQRNSKLADWFSFSSWSWFNNFPQIFLCCKSLGSLVFKALRWQWQALRAFPILLLWPLPFSSAEFKSHLQ